MIDWFDLFFEMIIADIPNVCKISPRPRITKETTQIPSIGVIAAGIVWYDENISRNARLRTEDPTDIEVFLCTTKISDVQLSGHVKIIFNFMLFFCGAITFEFMFRNMQENWLLYA